METLTSTAVQTSRLQQLQELKTPTEHISFRLTKGTMSQNGGTTWVAQVKIGTPPQSLAIMLDTGTLNTWVTASECPTGACAAHSSYDPKKSSSFTMMDSKPKTVDFGPWGSMSIQKGNDIIELNAPAMAVPVEEFEFMLAINYAGKDFKELVADGGLAIPAIPDTEATALLNCLFKNGSIEKPFVSFYYDKALGFGECRMGALNLNHFKRETLNRLALVTPYGGEELAYLWAVALESLSVGTNTIFNTNTETQLVLDTGSSFFKGAASVITPLINAVTKNNSLPTTITDLIELKNYEDLVITLNKVTYTLKPEQYFVQIGAEWVLGIQILEGMPAKMLLVGEVFLETVYTVFDFGNKDMNERSIFLATPIHKPLNATGTWTNEFGSTLVIGDIAENGTFTGTYSSDTGASGTYPVMGVADPKPTNSQTVSFSVTWRSLEGNPNPTWHYVSGITGVLSVVDGEEVLQTTMLLQKNLSKNVPSYEATSVSPLRFKRA